VVKETMLKQREVGNFQDARRRVEYALQSIKGEREKIYKMSQDAKEEIARGKAEIPNLKYTSDEEKQELEKMIAELEALSKEMQEKLEPPKLAPTPEKMTK
jgi:predicted  nucleic acid-binding Zn-ribbon protein